MDMETDKGMSKNRDRDTGKNRDRVTDMDKATATASERNRKIQRWEI
jgi:hypothetical protein